MSKKYKTYTEIQETFGQRNHENFDYYDSHDVCVIHVKFGHARKLYTGLTVENNLPQEFVTEYEKYWDGESDILTSAREVVDYIVYNDLPVILYANFTDTELDQEEIYEWLEMNS